jgi:hypothetical protein
MLGWLVFMDRVLISQMAVYALHCERCFVCIVFVGEIWCGNSLWVQYVMFYG